MCLQHVLVESKENKILSIAELNNPRVFDARLPRFAARWPWEPRTKALDLKSSLLQSFGMSSSSEYVFQKQNAFFTPLVVQGASVHHERHPREGRNPWLNQICSLRFYFSIAR